jgi:hypothetical protein
MSKNILTFSMNRCTSVKVLEESALRSTCRLQDTFTTATVELLVGLPNLEIIGATGELHHERNAIADPNSILQKVIGVRVGAGMLKIIKGLIGEAAELEQLAYMVEECCNGVILSLTKDILSRAPDDEEGKVSFYSKMVQDNVRMYNRCAAFALGTRLTEGIEPPA